MEFAYHICHVVQRVEAPLLRIQVLSSGIGDNIDDVDSDVSLRSYS
jgi:hypothetical protein